MVKVSLDEQAQAERFIRWLYGLDVRCVDMIGGRNEVLPLEGVLKVLKGFDEMEKKRCVRTGG